MSLRSRAYVAACCLPARFAEAAVITVALGVLILAGCAGNFGPSEVLPGVTVGAGYEASALPPVVAGDAGAEVDGFNGLCALLRLVHLDGRVNICPEPAPEQ